MSEFVPVQQPGLSGGNDTPPAGGGRSAGVAPAPLSPSDQNRIDNWNLLKGLLFAVILTALLYEVYPIPFLDEGRLLQVFDNPVSELIVGFSLWSLLVLLFKYLEFRVERRARRALDQESVLAVFANGVYARSVDDVLVRFDEALAKLKVKRYRQSVAVRRVERVLHYIRAVPKRESINDVLEFHAQIDVKRMETGYTILQVFIWALPILGLIGTVKGIGDSVSSFADFVKTAEVGANFAAQMRTALSQVTGGLAVAFNSTFLALLLVVPVMIVTSLLQKNEEENLLSLEDYCLEKLLPHLHVTPTDAVTEGYDEHLHRMLQLSQTWLTQFEPVVQQLTRQTELAASQLAGIQPIVKGFTDRLLSGSPGSEGSEPPPTDRDPKTPTA
jgi:biopolymer transport protein ExbB/TolQ